LLNLFITLLWVLLKDETGLHLHTIVTGFIIGSFITLIMRRFFGGQFYLIRVFAMVKLVLIFISETLQFSVFVIKHVVSPILTIKTILTSDWEVTTLSLLLTLTPGSVVMEINEAGDVLFVHAMDIKRYKGDLESSLKRFEKAIMEVTR